MQQVIRKPSLITVGAIGLLLVALVISARRTEAQFASPVNVMNSPAAPANIRDSDQAARHPFQAGAPIGVDCSQTGIVAVPQHQEAVIEFVSFLADTIAASAPDLVIVVTQGGFKSFHHIALISQGPSQIINGGLHFAASQSLRLYADPGSTISMGACAGGTSLQGTFPSISGYYVGVP